MLVKQVTTTRLYMNKSSCRMTQPRPKKKIKQNKNPQLNLSGSDKKDIKKVCLASYFRLYCSQATLQEHWCLLKRGTSVIADASVALSTADGSHNNTSCTVQRINKLGRIIRACLMEVSDKGRDVLKVDFILQISSIWVRIYIAQGKWRLFTDLRCSETSVFA